MKKFLCSIFVLIVCLSAATGSCAGGFLNNSEEIENAAKSVLKLYIYDSLSGDEKDCIGTGSGFVAFDSHTLITNYHVIDYAMMIYGSDDNDNTYKIDRVLCADKTADIAILGFAEETKLKPLELYPNGKLKRGSPVLAIGSPKGIKNTVSTGVISSQYTTEDGVPIIQTTAPLSPGSSGGALFNDDGKVIGVTTAIYGNKDKYGQDTNAQNLNYAVNIAVAQAMYNAWDGKEYSFSNHKKTAKMDYTGVYETPVLTETPTLTPAPTTSDEKESWTCLTCGRVNTTSYCLQCGAEKTYWVCSCGRINNNRFCGDCGQDVKALTEQFSEAILKATDHDYTEAVRILEKLGRFNSGSVVTAAGNYVDAGEYISKMYYDQGVYLQSQNGGYEEIIQAFTKAGDYSDSKVRIQEVYYIQAEAELKKGETETAIDFFSKAGDYRDSKEKAARIEYDGKRKIYDSASEAFDKGDYKKAYSLFSEVPGFEDADQQVAVAMLRDAEKRYEATDTNPDTMMYSNEIELKYILTDLGDYRSNADADKLYKRICYDIARFYQRKLFVEYAIQYFKMAEDYSDAEEQLMKCLTEKMNDCISEGKVSDLVKYYQEEIGNKYDLYIMKPGSKGIHVAHVFNLLKPLGIKGEIEDVYEYKEEYTPYVKAIEEHFGMTADGYISLNEYSLLDGALYQGCESSQVAKALEYLADLSYISSLPSNHWKFEEKYVKAVKKAEKALGLLADGIITQEEYKKITAQKVTAPENPKNLKASVKNDTVTLNWSKVPGAAGYDIMNGPNRIGYTDKTSWIIGDVQTGKKHEYTVVAKKYTVKSDGVSVSVDVPKYYQPVTVGQLNDKLNDYTGKYVKLNNLFCESWAIVSPTGTISRDPDLLYGTRHTNHYDFYLLCRSGDDYVELILEDIKGWGWEDDTDFLNDTNRVLIISINGTVQSKTSNWTTVKNIPSVITDYVHWN